MATHKPFRELVKPGSNFEFVGRQRLWITISLLLIAGSIAMLFINKALPSRGAYLNWTIDFKGGTELIFEFCDTKNGEHAEGVVAGDVRQALRGAGFSGFDVSAFTWDGHKKCTKPGDTKKTDEGGDMQVHGVLVRTPDFGALTDQQKTDIDDALRKKLAEACTDKPDTCGLESAIWSGDRLSIRSKRSPDEAAVRDFFKKRDLEVKPGEAGFLVEKEKGVEEYSTDITIFGLDRQFKAAIDKGLDGSESRVVNSYGVGAKAGERLKDDGIKSLFYAMVLIILYLAFRFDIRYAPGAVIALIHDALIVTGVFALTWTDVSLTSVAALLTVIGYSVNDTVIIFDRVRENAGRLKDKKLERVVNISLNETLTRTLLTSLTLFVVTMMMNIFADGLVRNFAFAMNIGVVVGTYSSIFIASPLFLWIDRTFYPPKGPTKGEGQKGRRRGGRPKKSESAATDDGE